jgi:predicted dehydrogenase
MVRLARAGGILVAQLDPASALRWAGQRDAANTGRYQLRVAIIGAGYWGRKLIRTYSSMEGTLVCWVVDRELRHVDEVASEVAHTAISADLADCFLDQSIQAVVIATPASTHFEIARSALLSGKHVFVEKPLATTSADAESLCRLAEEHGLVLMVGHTFLYNEAIQRIKYCIDAGYLGNLCYVTTVRTNLGPIRVDVDAGWDLAAHDVAIMNYLLDSSPLSVSASGGQWVNRGIDDAVFATLRYPKNVLVNVTVSWLNPVKTRQITIVGDRRMLTFDDSRRLEPLALYDKGVEDAPSPSGVHARTEVYSGMEVVPRFLMEEPLRAECVGFVEAIRDGRPLLSSGGDGLAVVRVLEAITESAGRSGQQVSISRPGPVL